MTSFHGGRTVTVFGGSGFVGRHVVSALARRGYRVRAAVRRPDLAGHLRPLGELGQIHAVQANVRIDWSVERAVDGAHAVVNLVGILGESGKQRFDAVHVEGARAIAKAARKAGARLVHMSAIGADRQSASNYARSKGEGEAAVRRAAGQAVIVRPSIVFGPLDDFFNRFAAMAQLSPVLPLIGGGHTRFQPVYVGDVAEAIAGAVDGRLAHGRSYELGGPEIVTFRQCMELMLAEIGRSRALVSIPWPIARLVARLTGWLPGAPITLDQVIMLGQDNIVSAGAIRQKRTLEGIGVTPRTMASVLPSYLVRFRPHGQFSRPVDA